MVFWGYYPGISNAFIQHARSFVYQVRRTPGETGMQRYVGHVLEDTWKTLVSRAEHPIGGAAHKPFQSGTNLNLKPPRAMCTWTIHAEPLQDYNERNFCGSQLSKNFPGIWNWNVYSYALCREYKDCFKRRTFGTYALVPRGINSKP